MNLAILLYFLVGSAANAAAATFTRGGVETRTYKDQFERALSGSGDMMSFDDDFWSYDVGSMETYWADYSMMPKKCMIL